MSVTTTAPTAHIEVKLKTGEGVEPFTRLDKVGLPLCHFKTFSLPLLTIKQIRDEVSGWLRNQFVHLKVDQALTGFGRWYLMIGVQSISCYSFMVVIADF